LDWAPRFFVPALVFSGAERQQPPKMMRHASSSLALRDENAPLHPLNSDRPPHMTTMREKKRSPKAKSRAQTMHRSKSKSKSTSRALVQRAPVNPRKLAQVKAMLSKAVDEIAKCRAAGREPDAELISYATALQTAVARIKTALL
jgi:hypothetical protein